MKLRRFAFWFLAVLVGLLAAGCCCKETGKKAGAGTAAGPGPATTPEAPEEPKAPVVKTPDMDVSASQLQKDYKANEVAADNKYKDKLLRVTGTVESIEKDFLDNVVLKLATGDMFVEVHATLEDSEKSKAAELSKGKRVRVVCTGGGMVMMSPMLRACTLE